MVCIDTTALTGLSLKVIVLDDTVIGKRAFIVLTYRYNTFDSLSIPTVVPTVYPASTHVW